VSGPDLRGDNLRFEVQEKKKLREAAVNKGKEINPELFYQIHLHSS